MPRTRRTRCGFELPDGVPLTAGRDDLDDALSQRLGRAVRLERRAEPYFDCARVHLLTTATLARLGMENPGSRFDPRRFRPNVLIDTPQAGAAFAEDTWVGRTVTLGDEVALRVTGPCPRCVMITLPQGDLDPDPDILRTATRLNEANVGVYAEVVRPGTLRLGDGVRLD